MILKKRYFVGGPTGRNRVAFASAQRVLLVRSVWARMKEERVDPVSVSNATSRYLYIFAEDFKRGGIKTPPA